MKVDIQTRIMPNFAFFASNINPYQLLSTLINLMRGSGESNFGVKGTPSRTSEMDFSLVKFGILQEISVPAQFNIAEKKFFSNLALENCSVLKNEYRGLRSPNDIWKYAH